MLSSSIPLIFLFLGILLLGSDAKNPDKHPNQGILYPYAPTSFDDLSLSASDEKTLANGKNVMKQIDVDGTGKATCVQDIDAPPSQIWNQILDLDHYVGKVPKLKECKNYHCKEETVEGEANGEKIKVRVCCGESDVV